jgi:hypothetical protein
MSLRVGLGLCTEVSQMSSQLSTIGDAVQSYLETTRIQVYTRDGVFLDDALANLSEKITNIYHRLEITDDRVERVQILAENATTRDESKMMNDQVKQNGIIVSESAAAVELLQQKVSQQAEDLNERWGVIKKMFATEVTQFQATLNQKPSYADLQDLVKHSDLAVLCTLFSSLPQTKRVQIKDILPQVSRDTSLTMQDKLKLAFERLYIERNRVDLEGTESVKEFEQLGQLVILQNDDLPTGVVKVEVEVRDVETDSGYSEASAPRPFVFLRGREARKSVATMFKGEKDCQCVHEGDLASLLTAAIDRSKVESAAVDVPTIVREVLTHCQPIIERQLSSIAGAFGANIDSGDIHTLIEELKAVEAVKAEMTALKLKLKLKVDNSLFAHELQKYVKREQFFEMMEQSTGHTKRPVPRLPKVKTFKQEGTPPVSGRPRPDVKAPVGLVPARNPKMLSVNEKYLIGDNGKTYLKESSRIGDRG